MRLAKAARCILCRNLNWSMNRMRLFERSHLCVPASDQPTSMPSADELIESVLRAMGRAYRASMLRHQTHWAGGQRERPRTGLELPLAPERLDRRKPRPHDS
jgi:hypothetical protein